MRRRNKIAVVGAGNVGATTAQKVLELNLGDVVLVDVVEGVPQGKGLDLAESAPVVGLNGYISGTNGYEATANSDLIIITAGLARKPGMSRDDLLAANVKIVAEVAKSAAPLSPDAVIIVVTNPMDVMAYVVAQVSGFPKERVIGMGGVLDSARFRAFISFELGVSVENTHAFVLGGHGDAMVPLPRFSTVAGIPITELMTPERIAALVDRTKNGGAEIVGLLKTGSAYYAPAASTAQMAEAILMDQKKVLPCSVYLNGEYGHSGVYAGVPVMLGAGGAEKVFEIKLTAEEQAAFDKSADAVAKGQAATGF
ncbi:MAG: malate dehydrogenase [Nitrospirae bacterium]|nr:malate dehydrogenase [Nitrospirota bacterium]